jgi:hypothetical protein
VTAPEPASIAQALTLGVFPRPEGRWKELLRKEVIQPQVPLRLPCYDFTPVTDHSLGTYLPCGLVQPLLEQSTPMV